MSQRNPDAINAALHFAAGADKALIGDHWSAGSSGKMMKLFNPATGDPIAQVAQLEAADLENAIRTARRSFDDRRWRGMNGDERARILWRIAELIEANLDELAALETLNNGGLYSTMQWAVASAAECFRYYSGACVRNHGITTDLSRWNVHHRAEAEPVGVAGLIVPWNGPLLMAAWKVAPALAAGCSAILKPADETPLTSLRLGELLLEAGLPAGVVSVVTGIGAVLGEQMGVHDKIDKISFTGSTAVGRSLIRAAAGNFKRLTLELGGKSAFIICADADLTTAIPAAAAAIFANCGQFCTAGSRLLVAREVYQDVVSGIAELAQRITIGSPFDSATQMGPLVSARHLNRVSAMIDSGIAQGATLLQGGRRHGDVGCFLQPTIFVDTDPTMQIVSEEIFGPVLTISTFETVEEAIHIANDHIYGLAAYGWSESISACNRLASQLRAGTVWINTGPVLDYAAPFGGFKQSGWGREHGPEGTDAYLETKSIFMRL